jgi:hypothetical protein
MGLGLENDCAGEGQQQLYRTHVSYRQRERPTSTNPQVSDSKTSGRKPKMGTLFQDTLAD